MTHRARSCALLMLILVAAGSPSAQGIDEVVTRWLQQQPPSWEAITVRHLLTHTSGLVRESPGFDFSKVQPDIDVVRAAYGVPLSFRPGDKWAYSNLGYFVLGEIISRASGRPWPEFMAERVFVPLGMPARDEPRRHYPEPRARIRVGQGQVPERG